MKKRLNCLEKKIDTTRKSFYEIGRSLKEIRDKRLYKVALYDRFENYTKERFDIGKSKAYRLIKASDVIDNLSPIGDRLPSNEAQVRPLTQFTKKEQREIWRNFLTSGMAVQALDINDFVKNYQDQPPQKKDQAEIISESYHKAVMAMMEEIRGAQNDNWMSTSRSTALMWNRIMRDEIALNQDAGSGGKNGR